MKLENHTLTSADVLIGRKPPPAEVKGDCYIEKVSVRSVPIIFLD